jgi:hypothetical protein
MVCRPSLSPSIGPSQGRRALRTRTRCRPAGSIIAKKFHRSQKSPVVYKCIIATAAPEMLMLTRRIVLVTSLTGVLVATMFGHALAESPASADPAAMINAIYTRVAAGKGDSGGGFVIDGKAARAKYLSTSLIQLWAKADAHTPKGDEGPVDFDPVTNSQDPDVKSFKLVTEKSDADTALIAVTLTPHATAPKSENFVIRYAMVRDGSTWKIDDIRGTTQGEAWSVRGLLSDSLKH